MGLDPSTTIQLSNLFGDLAKTNDPRVVLALRPQDPIPNWITHILFLGENLRITHSGTKAEVGEALKAAAANPSVIDPDSATEVPRFFTEFGRSLTEIGVSIDLEKMSARQRKQYLPAKKAYDEGDRSPATLQNLTLGGFSTGESRNKDFPSEPPLGEPVIEMDGVVVKYGEKVVLGKGLQSDQGVVREDEGLFWHVHRGQRWGVFGPNGKVHATAS